MRSPERLPSPEQVGRPIVARILRRAALTRSVVKPKVVSLNAFDRRVPKPCANSMAVSLTGLDRNFQAIRFRHDRAGDVWIVRAVGVVGLVEVKDGCTVLCGSDFEEAPCAVGSLAAVASRNMIVHSPLADSNGSSVKDFPMSVNAICPGTFIFRVPPVVSGTATIIGSSSAVYLVFNAVRRAKQETNAIHGIFSSTRSRCRAY